MGEIGEVTYRERERKKGGKRRGRKRETSTLLEDERMERDARGKTEKSFDWCPIHKQQDTGKATQILDKCYKCSRGVPQTST